ncbi:unnamed protein product [Psylliodes chrysocephalus]|uniref:Uncharacterized protein n=1 Tax=Psylliodes chrysocephalus TaxID=3402493 RepID=A0A9P0G7G9_9CUCU|nr:unnamed protein product [Psylliodes chrysocephala]
MKAGAGHLRMAMVALAAAVTVAYPGTATASPPPENRYANGGGSEADRATDSHRENPAGAASRHSDNGDTHERWKRAFAPWNGEHSEFQTYSSFSVWKPAPYQLSRPYFIPVYGGSGRIPMYFPPQSFDYNSRYRPNNKPPFKGPPYLPPNTPTTKAPEETMTVASRFDFDDDDDRPVWIESNNNDKGMSNVPTRPPPPPKSAQDYPPLVHDPQDTGTIHLSAQDEDTINEIFNQDTFRTTQAPPRTLAPRPQRPQRPRTTTVPPVQGPSGPSNCVWAVVSCCSAATNVYPEKCFEQRGCPGPFWGSSPCDTEFAKAAVDAALNYYNQ